MRFNSAEEAFTHLESLNNLEKTPSLTAREYRLDRMKALLPVFGNPQESFKSIHVAGSKGKGSTSAFAAFILKEGGYKTGLFVSPHVETYKERISLCGEYFKDNVYIETITEMVETIEALPDGALPPGGPPTTFELLTLLAFLIFRKEGLEWAVFETGLGGRLDATNVLSPEACILTPIELEHTEFLGNTIAEIAGEKAGIIKNNIPVFSSSQKTEAAEVFRNKAAQMNSSLCFLPDVLDNIEMKDPFHAVFKWKSGTADALTLKMCGRIQAENAALASLCISNLLPGLDTLSGIETASLPGRSELFPNVRGTDSSVMIDGAHTPVSVDIAAEAFKSVYGNGTLIFGAVDGKDISGMAKNICSHFNTIIISTPGSFKPNSPETVFKIFKEINPRTVFEPDPEKALSAALSKGGAVLVTGSFYMAAEIRKLIS